MGAHRYQRLAVRLPLLVGVSVVDMWEKLIQAGGVTAIAIYMVQSIGHRIESMAGRLDKVVEEIRDLHVQIVALVARRGIRPSDTQSIKVERPPEGKAS
jgi:hypothetical protein